MKCNYINEIVITSGAKLAIFGAVWSVTNSGDNVIILNPSWVSYKDIVISLGAEARFLKADMDFNYDINVLDNLIDNNTKAMIVNSPCNPTGAMISEENMKSLAEICRKNDILLISDEIYHGIQYEKKAVSALEITDQCYVINSFSKFFSMTGWRVGWMVVPEDHIRVVERLAQNLFICPPHISQVAALEALSCENELSQYIEIYRKNRQIIMHELPQIGFQNFAPPDGAFYFYVDISRYSDDSLSFCDDVLEEVGVAITPGVDFDPERGNTTIRISYARSTDEISEGINRLGNFMKKRGYF